jgi:hypothetical protein
LLTRLRPQLALFATASIAAAALSGWIELTAKVPVTLPIDLGPGGQRSAPFSIYRQGLYEAVFEVDAIAPRAELICKLGASTPTATLAGCKTRPVALSWSIYRYGVLVARDEDGPEGAVDGDVSLDGGRAQREMGSVTLWPSLGYSLVVRSTTDARPLGLSHPVVLIQQTTLEIEKGLDLLLVFVELIVLTVVALLWLLVSLARAIVREYR